MKETFGLVDEYGPAKVVHIAEHRTGLRAVVVIDNVAAGPGMGGIRMAADADVAECAGLARAMTRKNAAAGLRHGGAKSVIIADPHMPLDRKEALIRAFACAIRDITDYIPGPDMGTNEQCLAWVYDEIGRAVGLPEELGGIPMDELGMTGFGVAVAAKVAARRIDLDLNGARVAVQGFGAVGQHSARRLVELGCVLVGAADSSATVASTSGLDLADLLALKAAGGHLSDFGDAKVDNRDAIVEVNCDIWIPAARPSVVRIDNVDTLKARLVVQGANLPVTADAEIRLHERGVLSIPDFIANAGGVICGAVEYANGTAEEAFATIEARIGTNTERMLERATANGISARAAAEQMATAAIEQAMSFRRWN